jgi:peptidoglycan-associated lipoprotein
MTRHALVATAAAALLGSVACSHHEELKQTPKLPTAVAAPPAPRAAKVPPATAEVDTPKTKEDAAVYFDFDSALLRDEAHPVLQQVAETVQHRRSSVRIEGNCDEVGTVEYNLALGEERARAAKEYLMHLGVSPEKIATVTYGAQRPRYPGHDETAHAKNRRDDFLVH